MIEGVSSWFGWGSGCEVSGEGSIEERVSRVGKVLQNFSSSRCGFETMIASHGRSFSLLRFLGLAGLLVGARGQKTDPFPAVMDLADLDPSDGFVLDGIAPGGKLGIVMSSIGDINGDGVDDFAITSDYAGPAYSGSTFVIFGSKGIGKGEQVNLFRFDGSNGFVVDLGGMRSISGGSDINADTIHDLILGKPFRNPFGEVYVIYGNKKVSRAGNFKINSLNGTNGFVIKGESGGLGGSVSTGGDVNGDGVADLLIGSGGAADPQGVVNAGAVYLIYGGRNIRDIRSVANFSSDGTLGCTFYGENRGDVLEGVSMLGDINQDGIADFLMGARFAKFDSWENPGICYLVFGSRNLCPGGGIDLTNLNGTKGVKFIGHRENVHLGARVIDIGDFNVDGFSDFMFSAKDNVTFERERYSSLNIVYGKKQLESFDPLQLNGTNGFRIVSRIRKEGIKHGASADMNGDGIKDVIIGVPGKSPLNRTGAGRVYVVYAGMGTGRDGLFDVSRINGSNGFEIIGEYAGDHVGKSVSFAGDINNDDVDDLLIGAPDASPNNMTNAGRVYVIFGRKVGHTGQVSVTEGEKTKVTSSTEEKGTQGVTASSMGSIISTETLILASNEAPRSSRLGIGVGVGVTAFVCSLVAGGLFYMRRKSASHTSSRSSDQEDPQAGYVSIDSALSGMQSARAEIAPNSNYDIIPSMFPNDDYNNWPSKPPEHKVEDYNKVGLNTLNRKMDEYNAVKFKDSHEEYDDIPELKPMIASKQNEVRDD